MYNSVFFIVPTWMSAVIVFSGKTLSTSIHSIPVKVSNILSYCFTAEPQTHAMGLFSYLVLINVFSDLLTGVIFHSIYFPLIFIFMCFL